MHIDTEIIKKSLKAVHKRT